MLASEAVVFAGGQLKNKKATLFIDEWVALQ